MSPKHRILLIGMMGAGKTTVGHALASLTGWPYLDNDELVQQATGQSTPEILARQNEDTMRRAEAAALENALAAAPPVIASVAAGVVLDPRSRKRMADSSFVVYLRAPVAVLAERVGTGTGRPWVEKDASQVLERLYQGREPLFREVADLVLDVDGSTPEQLAGAILRAVTQRFE